MAVSFDLKCANAFEIARHFHLPRPLGASACSNFGGWFRRETSCINSCVAVTKHTRQQSLLSLETFCGPAIARGAVGAAAQHSGNGVAPKLARHHGAQRPQRLVGPVAVCLTIQMLPQRRQALLAAAAPAEEQEPRIQAVLQSSVPIMMSRAMWSNAARACHREEQLCT